MLWLAARPTRLGPNETPACHPHPPNCLPTHRPHHRTAGRHSGVLALGRSRSVMRGTMPNDREDPPTTRSRITRPTLTGGYPEPEDRVELMHKEWMWCGYHKSHPMISYDPAGDPYCWEGYWYGEVDECSSVPPIWVHIALPDNSFNFSWSGAGS